MDPIYWLALAVFLLAGTVKGALGIGLPTTVISILSQFTDPRVAIALGITPMIVSNMWQFYREGEWAATIRRFWPFAAVLLVTLFLASRYAAYASTDALLLITGLSIVLFAIASLLGEPPRMPAGWEMRGQVFAGAASGVMGGFAGLWSPPMVVLLLSLRLEKSEYVRTFGFLLLMGAAPLLAGYASTGLMTRELFIASVVMVAPTLAGFTLGERIRRRLDTARFQKAILIFFLLMGLNLIRRMLTG